MPKFEFGVPMKSPPHASPNTAADRVSSYEWTPVVLPADLPSFSDERLKLIHTMHVPLHGSIVMNPAEDSHGFTIFVEPAFRDLFVVTVRDESFATGRNGRALDFVEGDLVGGAVVELGRPRRLVRSDLLRVP